jgi:7-carboxy-7-deazaguanine synthase
MSDTAGTVREFLRITEIFHSVQGESTWAGLPCTFVRLTGCPLRCTWCDTEYAFHGGEKMSLDAIIARVEEIGTKVVEVTGGEPLIHPNAFVLTERLLDRGFTVLVETSGAFDIEPLDPRAHRIMDMKCPGSGEESRNLWSNLDHLTARDEIKFVIAGRVYYDWSRDFFSERMLDVIVLRG